MWVLVGDIGGSNICLTACEIQGRKKVALSTLFLVRRRRFVRSLEG